MERVAYQSLYGDWPEEYRKRKVRLRCLGQTAEDRTRTEVTSTEGVAITRKTEVGIVPGR